MSSEFWLLAVGAVLLYAVLFYVDRRWGRRIIMRDFNEREKVLAQSIIKSEDAYKRMENTVDYLQRQLDEKDRQLFTMRLNLDEREKQSQERDRQLERLTEQVEKLKGELETERRKVADLTRQLEAKQLIEQPESAELTVLGIWPDTPGQPLLDQQSEADSLYNAGYQYTALRGARANRGGVVLEIDRVRPNVIQVGSHGSAEGILLSDGVAEPGWWGRVLSGKGVKLMVLLACDSSQQDEINVSDALIAAGVKAVVSCDSAIGDKDAVRFAQLLYANMSAKMPLNRAVDRAKLAVSRKAAEMIRLREGN